MRLSLRTRGGIPAAKVTYVAAVGLLLGGCHASERTLARDAFVAAHGCPKNQVVVSGNGDSVPIEAVGCGHRVQYSCPTSIVCVSVQDLAVSAASSTWSCPEERIQVGSSRPPDPPQPPADIAADPARLAIWKGQLASPVTHRTLTASGCGEEGDVSCTYTIDPGVPGITNSVGIWGCFAPPSGATARSRSAPNSGPLGLGLLGPSVYELRPGSPGDKAGLASGDVLLEVDHQSVGQGLEAGKRIVDLLRVASVSGHAIRVRRGTSTLDLTIQAATATSPPVSAPSSSAPAAPTPSPSATIPSPAPTAR